MGETRLAGAIARIEGRFGVHALARGETSERRRNEIVIPTKTSLDRVIGGGLAAGEPLAFVGPPSVGKLSLALRAVVGAQAQGGMVAWIDPMASFDPHAAERAGVDLERIIVVRARREAVALASAAALRSEGFRLVVVDAGDPAFGGADVDDLAPALPAVRGSSAALLVVAAKRGRRVAVPAFVFERVAWERRFDRTVGWSFSVGGTRGQSPLGCRAVFSLTDGVLADLGTSADLAEVAV
jgi:predicted ATP-dependent serine protease